MPAKASRWNRCSTPWASLALIWKKRFKEEVGETIHTVIHSEKLEKARSLLVSTSLSINEISQMCGYPSLQYFYSVFKKEYDVTPKEYRDRHSEVML
ncbi:Xylose activator XylR (AraC family) [Klebsiella pneumoniae]|uniref:Xylose activator XylR (AraC family) n=1 Tax=Klebsiella pneumoniae TaxID=573 RepID=A0A377VTP2_KLEPN|nr:Xylose activator XylR (AraC family) [Klebsiella pneumoniae]